MKALELVGGEVVKHSGHLHHILEVRHWRGITCCITATGGRISFFSADSVEVV